MSQATDQYRAAVSRYEEAERERDALKAELAAIRALGSAGEADQPNDSKMEQAPKNNLPSWGECAMRVENSNNIEKRIASGGHWADSDVKLAKQLHRFIYEYDDSESYRSAWFLHRLELVLNEVRSDQPAGEAEPVAWIGPGFDVEFCKKPWMGSDWKPLYTTPQQSQPLTDEQFCLIKNRLSHHEGWDGDGWDLALKDEIEHHHGIKKGGTE